MFAPGILKSACRYGDDVERYLDVYLKTPELSKSKLAKALLARAHAREACGESLLAQAHEGAPTPCSFLWIVV